MKILAVGGGSGGHVTPIAAVIKVLLDEDRSHELYVWTDRSFYKQAANTIGDIDTTIPVDAIFSGKFRRYHSLAIWKQLLRLKTIVFPNIRDGLYIAIGIVQSYFKLATLKPDVVFCKGGYVCLPVGIAAKLLSIPIVLHDSDAHPGLANRTLSRWAAAIGTGAPLEYYNYPEAIAKYVGIPVNSHFREYSDAQRATLKEELGFLKDNPLLVITGGGLGSETINNAAIAITPDLLSICNIILISGTKAYDAIKAKTAMLDSTKFHLHGYVAADMYKMLAAADVVVSRAGATTLLELAALSKPSIIIPNPYLTGGHQLKNAAVYAQSNACMIVSEEALRDTPNELLNAVNALMLNPNDRQSMSIAIHAFARPDAALDMADMITRVAESKTK